MKLNQRRGACRRQAKSRGRDRKLINTSQDSACGGQTWRRAMFNIHHAKRYVIDGVRKQPRQDPYLAISHVR
jgi:hypothetical protein